MSERICAVVVTHNRFGLLQACIERLRHQTHPLTEIIIVDNASTDGTHEWLDAQSDLLTLHQENLGEAVGYANGMKVGYAHQDAWYWLLDDDCMPAYDALERLMEVTALYPAEHIFNSMCLAQEEPTRPTHGAVCLRTDKNEFLYGEYVYSAAELRARAGTAGVLDSVGGQLYLGTLVHRQVIETVGLPLPFYFMWGDEIDYSLRMMQAGYRIWIVLASVVYHPAAKILFLNVLGRRLPSQKMSPTRRYYSIRNSIYIRKKFYAVHPFLPYVARRVVGALFTELIVDRQRVWRAKWDGCAAVWRGTWDGLRWRVQGAE